MNFSGKIDFGLWWRNEINLDENGGIEHKKHLKLDHVQKTFFSDFFVRLSNTAPEVDSHLFSPTNKQKRMLSEQTCSFVRISTFAVI